ncbi:MAG: hypothetical protein ABIN94_19815 [Ferruginibacter sp.]
MKKVWVLVTIVFMGCGAKSNEEIAKDLIKEKLKSSLPNAKGYEPVNFGALGTAFMPYEESAGYIGNMKHIKVYKDSADLLQKTTVLDNSGKKKLEVILDSIKAKNQRNSAEKQSYVPGKLFKMTHDYTVKDETGIEKKTEDEFYFDKDLKSVVKVHKVY